MADEWMDEALCAQADPELWFPQTLQSEQCAEARLICSRCPVMQQCGEYATRVGATHGVWAGTKLDSLVDPQDVFPHGTEVGYQRHVRERKQPCYSCRRAHRYATERGLQVCSTQTGTMTS